MPVPGTDEVPRVGLVLGGGGTIGAAYHAGVLAALHHDLGWDARRAEVVVGTSAGSLVGGLLRLGVPPDDLAALTVGGSALQSHPAVVKALVERPALPPFTLLVCATRRRDCHRTVFGNGGRAAALSQAVAASCAVPGYFRGVEIDGDCYVDGGVISATNADVLRRHDVDLAVVVSPMSGTTRGRSVADTIRRVCRRAVDAERGVLRRHGVPSVVIEPGPEVLAHMTTDFMSDEALSDIVRGAFLETGAQVLREVELTSLRPARRRAS